MLLRLSLPRFGKVQELSDVHMLFLLSWPSGKSRTYPPAMVACRDIAIPCRLTRIFECTLPRAVIYIPSLGYFLALFIGRSAIARTRQKSRTDGADANIGIG